MDKTAILMYNTANGSEVLLINIMSKTDKKQYAPQVALHIQWKVISDRTYNVICNHKLSDINIAIRTIGGRGRLLLTDDTEHELDENTLFLTAKNKIKQYYCYSDKWDFHWFEFYSEPNIKDYLNRIYQIDIVEGEVQEMDKCFDYLGMGTLYSSQIASAIFAIIYTDWMKCINSVTNNNHLYQTIFGMIKNLSANLSVQELAHTANISERSLRNQFYKYTGISPKKYIEKRKLESAMELILTTQLQIKEISQISGYSDQYYFSRAFSKHYGNPPLHYKNQK